MTRGLLLSALLAASCTPDASEPGVCAQYGVRETGTPQAASIIERPVTVEDAQAICNSDGCVKVRDGVAYAYYSEGDGCLRVHEVCHAHEGPYHTVKYTQRVIAGQPRPACP